MTGMTVTSPAATLSLQFTAWLVTYILHSTLLVGAVWVIARLLKFRAMKIQDALWKTALVGGLVTASLHTFLGLGAFSVMCADGVVVARSGFHCSMNYRSVVVFGNGEAVPAEEHETVLNAFVEALIPGHAAAVRPPTSQELAATSAVRLPIGEGSTKIRTGPANDAESDLDSDVWAGVIPLATVAGTPVSNPDLKPGIAMPGYIEGYTPPA